MNKIFYTDGACSGNPGPGGYAVVSLEENELVYSYVEDFPNTTNNRMEMKALIEALKWARSENLFAVPIYSDSAYVVNLYNDWMFKWARAGWTRSKGARVENLDLVKELYDLSFLCSCEVLKIKGHDGVFDNELCDALASKNTQKLEKLLKSENVFKSSEILGEYYKKL